MNGLLPAIGQALRSACWFGGDGAYVLLDGQFGSTGKGLVASLLARLLLRGEFRSYVDVVTTNAGPNSGHTSFGEGGGKLVLQQIPTLAAHLWQNGVGVATHLNAGAVIDPGVLEGDLERIGSSLAKTYLTVHPLAALIDDYAHNVDGELTEHIGSTGKGVGTAIARKVNRVGGKVARSAPGLKKFIDPGMTAGFGTVFVETAQGFDLSINGDFYPYCTSRECTVMQALSDARIHPKSYRDTIMVLRTFPIRVAGNSGPVWPDQQELSWEDLGQVPEITTVTRKVRRVFTWSRAQFRHAVAVNKPGILFINFMNYLPEEERPLFIRQMIRDYCETLGHEPRVILGGYGPKVEDCILEYRS